MAFRSVFLSGIVTILVGTQFQSGFAETVRIATYNLENYLENPIGTRPAKSVEAKAEICENIRTLRPDIIAVQEIGSRSALEELQRMLKSQGVEFKDQEFVEGADPAIRIAVLSRYSIIARRSHPQESFLLRGRRFRVSRGFVEVQIKVNESYTFILVSAHLKSRRVGAEADEAELRLEEAKLLRDKVD